MFRVAVQLKWFIVFGGLTFRDSMDGTMSGAVNLFTIFGSCLNFLNSLIKMCRNFSTSPKINLNNLQPKTLHKQEVYVFEQPLGADVIYEYSAWIISLNSFPEIPPSNRIIDHLCRSSTSTFLRCDWITNFFSFFPYNYYVCSYIIISCSYFWWFPVLKIQPTTMPIKCCARFKCFRFFVSSRLVMFIKR